MKLSIKAKLKKKADSPVEVYHRKDSKSDEDWVASKLKENKIVMSEEGTDRYFAGTDEESIFDWYAFETPPEEHKTLERIQLLNLW